MSGMGFKFHAQTLICRTSKIGEGQQGYPNVPDIELLKVIEVWASRQQHRFDVLMLDTKDMTDDEIDKEIESLKSPTEKMVEKWGRRRVLEYELLERLKKK